VATCLVDKHNLFVLEVVKVWTTSKRKRPKTIHRHGYGNFVVDGKTMTSKSKMP
jgi:hypothetical protein